MVAVPKIYSDAACTLELSAVGGVYQVQVGALTGLDGDTGEVAVTQLWVKNTGDQTYQNCVLTESADVGARALYSLDGVTYNATTITLGNIAAAANVTFYVKVSVAAATARGAYTATFGLSGKSI